MPSYSPRCWILFHFLLCKIDFNIFITRLCIPIHESASFQAVNCSGMLFVGVFQSLLLWWALTYYMWYRCMSKRSRKLRGKKTCLHKKPWAKAQQGAIASTWHTSHLQWVWPSPLYRLQKIKLNLMPCLRCENADLGIRRRSNADVQSD